MSIMKNALLKAGIKPAKSENEREYKKPKEQKKIEKHQQTRNFCEVCQTVQPDVERYQHRKAHIDGQWICAACADKEKILDECRMTHQSDFAIQKKFRREYGATKKFSENRIVNKDDDFRNRKDPRGEKNFNR